MVNSTIRIDGDINHLDNRTAMGLKPHYQTLRFQNLHRVMDSLRGLGIEELCELLNNPAIPLVQRYAAGSLLALLGDPRIDTYNPDMVEINDGTASIGLPVHRIEKIVAQYEALGVQYDWIEKEAPQFQTEVDHFSMGRYPVTNKEYHDFLLDNPNAEIPSSWVFGRYPSQKANHPVYTIHEQSAEAYAQWLSKKTGRSFRLPTEIEWEYAAGGPDALEFPWGAQFLPDHCNTAELHLFDSTPVGMFTEGASPFGLLDMAGNIEEYTACDYWVYPEGRFIADDLVRTQGRYRIARGGSFTRFQDLARCARRHGRYNKDIYVMGFRLAEDN